VPVGVFFGWTRIALSAAAIGLTIWWFVSAKARAFAARVPGWSIGIASAAIVGYMLASVALLSTPSEQSRVGAAATFATVLTFLAVPAVMWLSKGIGGGRARLMWLLALCGVASVPLYLLAIWLVVRLLPGTTMGPLDGWGGLFWAAAASVFVPAVYLPSILYVRSASQPRLSHTYGVSAVCLYLPFHPVVTLGVGLLVLGGLPRASRTSAST